MQVAAQGKGVVRHAGTPSDEVISDTYLLDVLVS